MENEPARNEVVEPVLVPVAASQPPQVVPVADDSGNRLTRLLWLLAIVALPLIAFRLATEWRYRMTHAEMQAKVDVATQGLTKVRAGLETFQLASQLVAQRIEPSVVSIHRPGMRGEEGQGSGVLVDAEGYIVTNFHVIEGALALHVMLADGRQKDATIVGADPGNDIAVLKIDRRVDEPPFIAAEWADSDKLEVGDLVWAAGSPFGLDQSVTFGIVSAKARRSGSGITGSVYQEYLQTDVAVNPGNSGGPLVDISGKVVGINTAILGPSYRGVSFAVPSAIAQQQYDQIRKTGYVERGYLGVEPRPVPAVVRERLALANGEGVYAAKVMQDGPARRAGIRPGDVILKWNDHAANEPTLLSREISATQVGSTADVLVKRIVGNQPTEVRLKVEVGRSVYGMK